MLVHVKLQMDEVLYTFDLKGVYTRPAQKVYSHFEYLENRLRGLDVTWHPDRGDPTAHP
jgi:hypothetical protein